MSKFKFISILFISLLLSGCSSTSSLSQLNDKAGKAGMAGDWETAFKLYDDFIKNQESKNQEISGDVYGKAAKAALETNKFTEAEKYFKLAVYKGYSNADLYAAMINIYRNIDNLSKEMDALEYFVAHFKQDPREPEFKKRLFETYIESENWEKAVTIWKTLSPEDQMQKHMIELYFTAQKKLDNTQVCDQMAAILLKLDVTNKMALEWNAEKYFWKAENHYQQAMNDYEKNKTNKQYLIMVKELDGVTADFKKSLGYFEKLYKLYPSKEYAKFMSNIYIRFQDKDKSDYYLRLSK